MGAWTRRGTSSPADGMVRLAGLLDPTTRRRPFLDQRRPSFRRRWQQRPLWARLLHSLLLALAGSPDTSYPPHFAAPPIPSLRLRGTYEYELSGHRSIG
ncbi:putative galacturonosyltransferase 10 [Hordeum vulgare]|nr:putative galacturonosyltransferase 10 [Hordeum vulgare]